MFLLSPRHRSIVVSGLLVTALSYPFGIHAQSYDLTTMKLTLPIVGMGDQHYQSVVVKIDQMSIMDIDSPTVMALTWPTFNPADNTLLLPSVEVSGGDVYYGFYYGVAVKLEQFSVVSVGSSSSTTASGTCTGGGATMTYAGTSGPFANGEKVCVEGNGATTLTVGDKTLSNPVQNTAVIAPYAAYTFTDSTSGYRYEAILNSGNLHEINILSDGGFLGQLAP